jgi:hypothetical protein
LHILENINSRKLTFTIIESSELATLERKSELINTRQRIIILLFLEICELPVKEGQCSNYLVRYYYNTYSRECVDFVYTGCNGNMNNFLTYDECKNKCGEFAKDLSINLFCSFGVYFNVFLI